MANEPISKTPAPLPAAKPGGTPPAATLPPTAEPVASAKPVAAAQAGPVAAPASKSAALFGGHRGGGKKRADGLIAGSPEAIAADKEKNAARMREARAREKAATLPPPLPSVAATPGNPPVPAAGGVPAVPVAAVGALDAPAVAATVAAPLFVPWTERILARPVALFTKIIDRIRVSSVMNRVRKLALRPEQEKVIEQKVKFKEEAVRDFNAALTNCTVIELNKRRVMGSEHSHWLDLALTGGELVYSHVSLLDDIQKMILENESRKIPTAEIDEMLASRGMNPAEIIELKEKLAGKH